MRRLRKTGSGFLCNPQLSTVEDSFSLSRKGWSIVKRLAILGNFLQANNEEKL